MPIVGMTDRQAAFPEIGRIRKGAPKPEDGKKPGADLEYFRVEFDEAEAETAKVFDAHYGEKPDELNILLPFNTVDENFEAWREAYLAGGLIHRCDGQWVEYEIDHKTGEKVVANGNPRKACTGEPVAHYKKKDSNQMAPVYCTPSGRLKVLIPEIQRLAYLTVLTSSIHDIINISSQLEAILAINGRLAGVPLKLRRRPRKISTPSGNKRVRRTKHLLSIEADPQWVKAKLSEMKAAALPAGNGDELPLLDAPQPEAIEGEVFTVEEIDYPEGLADDAASRFWWYSSSVGIDRDAAASILEELKSDYEKALDVLKAQYTQGVLL